jgi:hypothetical protein
VLLARHEEREGVHVSKLSVQLAFGREGGGRASERRPPQVPHAAQLGVRELGPPVFELSLGLELLRHLRYRRRVGPTAAVEEDLLSFVALARIGVACGFKRGWWGVRGAIEGAGLLSDLVAHVEEGGCDVAEFRLALIDVLQHVVVLFDLHFVVIRRGREARETFL